QLFETGKTQTCDMQMIKNDGTEFRGHLATSMEKNVDGEPVWRAMLSDITDRKKLEDELRQSEQKLCNLADNLPNAIVYQLTAEPDGSRRFIYVSGGVERLNEVTVEEVLADATVLYSQVLPEYLPVVREREEEALRTLTTLWVEVQSRLPSGRLRWFEYTSTPRYLADGLLVWDGVEVDITDRKRAEDELRESERKLATLIGNIQGMVYFCLNDPDWTMKFVSGGALELTGYLPEELVDNAVVAYNDIIHPDDRQYVWDTVQDSFAARSAYTMEYRIVTKKGTVKRVWERGQGIFLPGGELHHLEGFIADITERKALEGQLRQAQKMESVGRLAGGVAHDFNNMLGVILGFVELALDRIDAAHPVHNDLLEIREAAKRSAGLTRQLLAFASLQPAAPKLLDLNEIIEGMLQMLRRLIGEDMNLIWMRGVGLGPVKMDPSQIDQILVNLCVNARDAISGPGNVTIETRAAAFDKSFCAEHPDFIPGDYVHLSVSDDGCGMDKETLANIFEPFFTTKGLIDGPGLGLSTIYGIVRQNNGFIDVHSEPGVGTTFNIYLPRHPVPIVPASVPASPEPLKHGRETILLVEDEPAVLKVTEMMLAHLGYSVLAVNTPDKAFRIAEAYAGDIALLITDVVMPEMNGKDLAMKLQSR
ncbi:MAG: PAS domain-containing protein, partial [Desulfosalsimonadaceae bacterium]|nr:PAS domain-containing protein [Desulfosalsimonadaceae bacterium]